MSLGAGSERRLYFRQIPVARMEEWKRKSTLLIELYGTYFLD
jgi:hypothetical protein